MHDQLLLLGEVLKQHLQNNTSLLPKALEPLPTVSMEYLILGMTFYLQRISKLK